MGSACCSLDQKEQCRRTALSLWGALCHLQHCTGNEGETRSAGSELCLWCLPRAGQTRCELTHVSHPGHQWSHKRGMATPVCAPELPPGNPAGMARAWAGESQRTGGLGSLVGSVCCGAV